MNKVLVVVDMQNDFIDGALANKDAQKIVDKMAKYVSKWDGAIIFTRDTHDTDYLSTMEGKYLPVPHCLGGTQGWEVNEKILNAAKANKKARLIFMDKGTFGAPNSLAIAVRNCAQKQQIDEIVFCGTCTDICVVSNVLGLKSAFSETLIKVVPALCAGLTPAKHKAAIEVMRSCQVEMVE